MSGLFNAPSTVYSRSMKHLIADEMTHADRENVLVSIRPDTLKRDLMQITGVEHLILLYQPTRAQIDRFIRGGQRRGNERNALLSLVKVALAYPEYPEFLKLCDLYPGYLKTFEVVALGLAEESVMKRGRPSPPVRRF